MLTSGLKRLKTTWCWSLSISGKQLVMYKMYKTLHGMTPDYLRSRFVYRDNVSAYRLRNTENKLVLPQP